MRALGRHWVFVASVTSAPLLGFACGSSQPPVAPDPIVEGQRTELDAAPPTVVAVPAPSAQTPESHPSATPLHAQHRDLLPGLGSARKITASIETDLGNLDCVLFHDKAPMTVENFVGLATGEKQWTDPRSGQWSNEPMYDGTDFHRVIPGFMIQGGDPKGDGTGEPGFTIKDEIWAGAKHDRAGLLCMANRGHDTNGGQFFITDAAAAHLDGNYTIFGECGPVSLVHQIAVVPTGSNNRPRTRVGIRRITIGIE